MFCRLSDFIKEGSGQCKCELIQILYPTFVSIYLDLIAKGVSAVGKVMGTFWKLFELSFKFLAASFYSNFVDKLDSPNQEELRELSGVVTMNDLASSPLADKFRYTTNTLSPIPYVYVTMCVTRNHRYHIKMSDTAFHCLMHFLQVIRKNFKCDRNKLFL